MFSHVILDVEGKVKATFSTTTEAIVNKLSIEGNLIYGFDLSLLFLEPTLNTMGEISANA